MRKIILKEIPFWIIISIPIFFLLKYWGNIAPQIPIHYNLKGEPDKWANKEILYWIFTIIPIMPYVFLFIISRITPNKIIAQMTNTLYFVRLSFSFMISIALLLMLYSLADRLSIFAPSIYILLSVLFVCLGVYFMRLKPNSYLGFGFIMQNEELGIWKKAHKHSGIFWVFLGIIMLIVNIYMPLQKIWFINILIIASMVIQPFLYTYYLFYNNLKAK